MTVSEQTEFTQGPPVDDVAGPPEPAPKRGPGRPRKDGSPAQPRKHREPKATGAKPRRGRPPGQSRKAKIGGLLTMFNMALQVTPLRSDALDALEIETLAKALDEEARKNATFAKYLDYALGVGGAGGIWSVVALIAMRRAARHGVLPPMFDSQAQMLLQLAGRTNTTGDNVVPFTPPAPDATE